MTGVAMIVCKRSAVTATARVSLSASLTDALVRRKCYQLIALDISALHCEPEKKLHPLLFTSDKGGGMFLPVFVYLSV